MINKLTCLALGLYSAAYLLLFLTWGAFLIFGHSSPEQAQYISYIRDALLMLTAHILTILNATPANNSGSPDLPPSKPQQP